jgi:hypothetical protein
MAMLLPDDEFRDFLDARAGFARKLLLSFALPSGTGPFVDESRTERADGGSLAPFLHAHHRMFMLDSAAAEAANASLRAQLAVTQESLEHALADVASARDRAAACQQQVAHAEERATAAEERAAAAEEWTTLAEERAAVAEERATAAEERAARVQQAAEQRDVNAGIRANNSARLVATMLDAFRTNVHSALGLP